MPSPLSPFEPISVLSTWSILMVFRRQLWSDWKMWSNTASSVGMHSVSAPVESTAQYQLSGAILRYGDCGPKDADQ